MEMGPLPAVPEAVPEAMFEAILEAVPEAVPEAVSEAVTEPLSLVLPSGEALAGGSAKTAGSLPATPPDSARLLLASSSCHQLSFPRGGAMVAICAMPFTKAKSP